ncbi:MAG: leucine-rich repeat domain-containing protein [Erysipelotrichaceae bacterium]|nr:leucine-rich repeat domain-containing protein [Erysipelotrichaceae bacterium]
MIKYEAIEGKAEAKVIDSSNLDMLVEIPTLYEGFPITVIGEEAMMEYDHLFSVWLPKTIRTIETSAFEGCGLLQEINLPEYLKEIQDYAFCNCDSLNINIIPDHVEYLGEGAFAYCHMMQEMILSSQLKVLKTNTFQECYALACLYVSEAIENIEDNVCEDETHLVKVKAEAFDLCRKQEAIIVNVDDPLYTTIDGVLYNKDCTTLIRYPANKKGDTFVIPNTVTKIERYAFDHNYELHKVIIPDSVTTIETGAFQFCERIVEIQLSKNVHKLPSEAFIYCSDLKAIDIFHVTEMEDTVFYSCQSIEELTLPKGLIKMDIQEFDECPKLILKVYKDSYALKFIKMHKWKYTIIDE